jgi:nucleoside-diphosphate-sugar epimerase
MKIFVAGHRGMVGSAIVRHLKSLGWTPSIPLEQGLTDAYAWFLNNQTSFRG